MLLDDLFEPIIPVGEFIRPSGTPKSDFHTHSSSIEYCRRNVWSNTTYLQSLPSNYG